MNIAAYCRVSTDKSDQLNSLEAQKRFLQSIRKRTVITLLNYMQMKAFQEQKLKIEKNFCSLCGMPGKVFLTW